MNKFGQNTLSSSLLLSALLFDVIIGLIASIITVVGMLCFTAPSIAFAGIGFLELDAGYSYLKYTEKHTSQPQSDINLEENATHFYTALKYGAWGGWLQILIDLDYVGPSLSSSQSNTNLAVLNQNSMMMLDLPAKPLHLALTVEYFYYRLYPNRSDFGYNSINGNRFSAIIYHTNEINSYNIYFKYPYWIGVKDRREYEAGARFAFQPKKMNGRSLLNFFQRWTFDVKYLYSFQDFKQRALPVSSDLKILSVSFGYSW